MIKKGYARAPEKIKEVPHGLTASVTGGTGSGRGKIDIKFYYGLVQI